MDESSQGSVELLDSVDMVPAHVEKLGGTIRDEDLHSQYIAIQRVPAGPGATQLLTSDIMQGHIQQHLVEEFNAHGEHDYYETHILQEHELADTDRHLAELQQAVVEEPQNLSAPVNVGDKPGLAAMVSAYIHTSGDLAGSHQIIIDTSERGSKLYQQRLPSLSSLPPLKKALTNSSIRSRYQRPSQSHHSMENEVTLSTMSSSHHTLDGTNVIVVDGQHLIQGDSSEGQRILEAEANGQTLLVEDPITQKLLQESSNVSHRLIAPDNQRILVAQDATAIAHSVPASSSSHRLANVMNGHHRTLDVQADQSTRFLSHQEASVVTSLASQRLLAHTHQIPSQVQSQADLDMTERLLDEESPDHQMLVQEQLIHVVLDPETQEQLGVVSAPGQRVLVQGPGGQWTEIDAGSCEAEAVDHDSRDTTLGEVQEQEESLRAGLIVKHEEVELTDGIGGDADGIVDGMESMEGVAEGSDGDVPVEDMNDSDYDVEGDMRTSRRSLPHKKRLSRKLRNPRKSMPSPRNIHAKCYKCNKCGEQFGTQASYASHRATHNPSNKKTLSFSCEICGKVIPNQLKFFEHLKAHYEPRSGGSQVNCGPSDASTSSESGITTYARSTPAQRSVANERTSDNQSHLKENMQSHIQNQPIQQPQSHQSQNIQVGQMPPTHSHHHPVQQSPQSTPQHQPHHPVQQPPQQHLRAVLRQPQHHQQRQSSQQGEMQTIILKVEDASVSHVMEKSQEQIHIQETQQIQELHHIQNHRQRPQVKHQDHLQNMPQHQQRPHHHAGQQANQHHPQQSSVQSTILNSDTSSMVPTLPPVSTITGPVSLTCNLCGKNFRRQKTYETHLSVAHPKQEDIEQFSEPEDMMEGIRGVVEAGEDSADDADSLVALTNLTPHSGDSLSKSHSESWYHEEGLSDADLQALQQADAGSEQQHQTHIQQAEVSHMCDLCGDAFHSKARLHQHVREEHLELRQKSGKKDSEDESADPTRNKKALRRLACPQCDRIFNHRNSLVYHLRSHSGERPHRCEECGKSFFATSALKVHMRLHSGDKPYKCEFCGRSFRQWGDLKYHCTSRHSEEKQYQCEYCGKDFARKYSLIVHRRIHTGEKNYVCEFCNKQFRASSYLQNHRRIHTGEKPHRCEVCNKPFRVRSDMKRHLNTHNRDRQRVVTSASNGPLGNNVRGNNHKMEVPDADPDVDAQDSGDHMQSMHNISLHELGNGSSLTIVKTDSDGMDSILPDAGSGQATPSASAQTPTTISLSTHTTDEGLQYTSERDPLDNRSQSATHLYVWPIYMT